MITVREGIHSQLKLTITIRANTPSLATEESGCILKETVERNKHKDNGKELQLTALNITSVHL